MAKQWRNAYLPNLEGNKLTPEYVATGVVVGADEVALYIGDDVPTYRQSEIVSAWRWLFDGVRERRLLDEGWTDVLYTAVDINAITTNNRRTTSDLALFTATDVIVGIGANIVNNESMKVMLENAVDDLTEFAIETRIIG